MDELREAGLGEFEAMATAVATVFDVGPAFGIAGPFGNSEPFTDGIEVVTNVVV